MDTTLRDGEQTIGVNFSVEDKIKIANNLEKWGIDVIEAGFPIASTADFAAVQAVEFYGDIIEKMGMEERMTLCNMAIEGGAKMGSVQPDAITFEYVNGRKYAPKNMDKAITYWQQFKTDSPDAFDQIIEMNVAQLASQISWGTNPGISVGVDEVLPAIKNEDDKKAYAYVDLVPGQKAMDIPINWAFFGSCTNGRLSDLKEAAKILAGKHINEKVTVWVVPGSQLIKQQAEALGLDQIFKTAGCEWREPGCSACLGMNPDQVPSGIHCASTSNRNFEGRQGVGSRTHLASPTMVAAAAINGHFIDIRKEVG
ncbi:aconitase family protein [Periweissella beninensis]|uniref:aconitase family protein n=1 Tax=Periweissella beninensis TaxID=504936 RepID=UPI00288A5006|nr:aconitase family protein [Periweissella beninensis]MCT4396111.1 hypothetical protein [Periweissella beninensis]